IVHWCKNKKKQSMIFKVDFEKAYNSVRLDFIDDILRRFGFGEKWCKINMNKSNLMGISVDSNKVKHAAAKIARMSILRNRVELNGKMVLAAKDVGGLGVSSLFALNWALMFKWVWRFFSQKNSLWVRVVKVLHGEDGKIGKKIQPMYPSTWLNIINEIESLKLHDIDLVCGNVYQDNINEYVSQAASANYNQGNTGFHPQMVANQIRPPGFPPIQNNQNNFNRGNNFTQNRGGNFNQSAFNQSQLHRPQVNQAPAYQAPIPQTQNVSQTDFERYVKANDAVLRNIQSQDQSTQTQCQNIQNQYQTVQN
nr:RNA-directed DNA polymerase, eukaryota, reverse transcriptase zinc-binding domain protein [Tanacetum cinerariifolium]